MKGKTIFIVLLALILFTLCACDDKSSASVATDDSDNRSAWCSALFESPATCYNNQLALMAAEMSAAAEDTTGDGIKELYSSYNIYSCELSNYTSGAKLFDLELSLGGGAFAIGQGALNIDGVDTTILVITVRGTTTWGETVGDLWKGWYGDPDKVHQFLNRTVWDNVYDFEELLWEGINAYVDKYPAIQTTEDLKILVTGHSLGGAAADMIGARFTSGIGDGEWWSDKVTKDDIYVYTFGAIKVLTTEENVSVGYENIHNIYNYYDSYGPNGNQKNTNASSLNAKFGHTEVFSFINRDESGTNVWDSCNNHIMQTYKDALEAHEIGRDSITLACEGQNWSQPDGPSAVPPTEENGNTPVSNDFVIEGTWKNVGTTTFGQAQLGSIIVFDGTHCNYYSPYDTYVINYENGQWILDCVSYIFAETLRFRVDIADEDSIDIYYGSDAVRLARIAQNAEIMQEPEQPQQAESDFAIEGSWLSVGSEGFGQAQPGMTITFDGTHCNFFSLYDTYAFYQENGQWKLDCTSFLFSENLTFTVEIVNSDAINIYSGSICTELERIN